MPLGTFQKETLKLKISKQLGNEATAQVKSKLENSDPVHASVLVPVALPPSCAGDAASREPSLRVARVSGAEGAALLSAPQVCLPGRLCPLSGELGLWETPEHWRRGRSHEAPTTGASTRLAEVGTGKVKVSLSHQRERVSVSHALPPSFLTAPPVLDWSVKAGHTRNE